MLEIVWSGNVDPSGYSSACRSYIKSLNKNKNCKIKFHITNVAKNINLQGIDSKDLLFFSKICTDDMWSSKIVVQHTVPDRLIIKQNFPIINYTVVEMEPPQRWIQILKKCDLIMTPSSFSKNKMSEFGTNDNKIEIIPHCYDTTIWNSNVRPLNIGNLVDFNFLFIGDYTPRKNGDLLIKSFIKTFAGKRDVSLTIKAYFNSFSQNDQKRLIERISKIINNCGIVKSEIPPIYFYGEPILENIMPRFMSSFDCLISPHRGEGWGLPLGQMMCLGKPVIATKYSGNLDFMNDENSYLIEIDGEEDVCPEMISINPNFQGKKWIKINEDDLCDKMNYVYNNRSEALSKGKIAMQSIHKNFSYEKISDKIISVLGAFK